MLRFAPSPTGDMQIENLREAIFNYMVAKQRGDTFLVRIEDSDKKRNIEGKDTEILQILEKFALKHDAVFHQSEHLNIHQTLALRLLEEGKAFICTCTAEEIEADRDAAKAGEGPYHYSGKCLEKGKEILKKLKEEKQPFVIRIKKPDHDIVTDDLIRGEIVSSPDEVDAFVILREDGTPTCDFASACDDMLSGVTFVIEGASYLSRTPRQRHIKAQLGYNEETRYAHLPAILYDNGAIALKELFAEGFVPDAIANYLILLGNSVPEEIFTIPEALTWFDLKQLSSSPVKFEKETLRYLNRKHLEKMDDRRLSMVFGFADASIGKLAKLYLGEASTLNELEAIIQAIFSPKSFSGVWEEQMRIMEKSIFEAPMIDTFDAFQTYLMRKSGLRGEAFSKPLRILLTGAEHGPELHDIYPYIKSYLLEVAS